MPYTPHQQRAIETDSRNLQIIACAGSGKTQVMAARVAHLLKTRAAEGVTPASIVAFTFTEKAGAELKDRIHRLCSEELGSDQGLGEMHRLFVVSSGFEELLDRRSQQVDDADERVIVSVSPGPAFGGLEDAVERFEASVAVA